MAPRFCYEVLIISALCSSTALRLALYKMYLLPRLNTAKLVIAQQAITPLMGNAV